MAPTMTGPADGILCLCRKGEICLVSIHNTHVNESSLDKCDLKKDNKTFESLGDYRVEVEIIFIRHFVLLLKLQGHGLA